MNAPSTPLPRLLALVVMSLAVAVIGYVAARRPRERSTWAFVCAGAGVLGIYLSEYLLYRTGLSAEEGFFWQKAMSVGAGLASIGAVGVALALRETPVPRWERALAWALTLRAVLDIVFIVTLVPNPQPDCMGPWGSPMLHCDRAHSLDASIALLTIPFAIGLFYRTYRLASDTRRRAFITYLLPAFLLICLGSIISILWGLRRVGPLFPTGIIVAPAAAFAATGLLHLETPSARDPALPTGLWLLLGWTGLLAAAFLVDARWLSGQAPLMSLLTLIGGLAAGLALMAWRAGPSQTAAPGAAGGADAVFPAPAGILDRQESTTMPVEAAGPVREDTVRLPGPAWRIHLFGSFCVERDGEKLPNHANVWRSDKSRSLLAYLALAGDQGLTREQLVDALWPLRDDGDGEAEQRSLNALRSYLSTVRKVLEPERPRSADSLIAHDGGRYRLVTRPEVWVDVREFERLTKETERLGAAGADAAAAETWECAIALHGELGLLPDEGYLPAEVIEAERERLRQQWLRGVRSLARCYAERGPVERAVMLWETAWRTAPLDAEAYRWLAGHYRRTGQAAAWAALEDTRRRAAAEIYGEEAA